MAIDSLCNILPGWKSWAKKASSMDMLKNAAYPFPDVTPTFLGTIVQNYRPRAGLPADSFQDWIDQINDKVASRLIPALEKIKMAFPLTEYDRMGMQDYCLATIPDFNSLIAKSQEKNTPVFALTQDQLDQTGVVLERSEETREKFKNMFVELSDKVVKLTQ